MDDKRLAASIQRHATALRREKKPNERHRRPSTGLSAVFATLANCLCERRIASLQRMAGQQPTTHNRVSSATAELVVCVVVRRHGGCNVQITRYLLLLLLLVRA